MEKQNRNSYPDPNWSDSDTYYITFPWKFSTFQTHPPPTSIPHLRHFHHPINPPRLCFMFSAELKQLTNSRPFNHLWPPTDLDSPILTRRVWFYWLTRGWVAEHPYHHLQILDYRPDLVEDRYYRRLNNKLTARRRHWFIVPKTRSPRRRERQLLARRRFRQEDLPKKVKIEQPDSPINYNIPCSPSIDEIIKNKKIKVEYLE